jgi:8-oxo-dGTP pyrophosphatase MutT (NUDIX family)
LAFDIPRNVILPIDRVDVRLDPEPHPFEHRHAAEIEANWQREKAANPTVHDGRMVLLSSLSHRDRQLEGRSHTIRFATFLYWRRHRSYSSAEHAYAHAALVTADNALLAIRMGPRTSNPGRVYFAAGSFEPTDFRDGVVDLDFNMKREVGEETGLDIGTLRRDPGYHAFSERAGTVIFRRYYLEEDADTAARSISSFVATEADPEIEGPVIIRDADTLPEGIMPHMVEIVRWHFSEDGQRRRGDKQMAPDMAAPLPRR